MVHINIIYRPLGSLTISCKENAIKFLIAMRTPLCFVLAFSKKICGYCLWEHFGALVVEKCVSCIHNTSPLSLWASDHISLPLTLKETNLVVIRSQDMISRCFVYKHMMMRNSSFQGIVRYRNIFILTEGKLNGKEILPPIGTKRCDQPVVC